MSRLAAAGNKVLFIENTGARRPGLRDLPRLRIRLRNWRKGIKGVRQESENLFIYSALVFPFPYSRFFLWINSKIITGTINKWLRAFGAHMPLIWTFLPTKLTLKIMEKIDAKGTIYYCIDSFPSISEGLKKIKFSESELVKKADLTFVTSKLLQKQCLEYGRLAHLFPFGVNFSKFAMAGTGGSSIPAELSSLKRHVIGYIGGIHKWVDLDLVRQLAISRPEWSFVFVGPLQTRVDSLTHLRNVHFLGARDHDILPGYVAGFDACIIPYSITEYTANVYPTKLNEYLAMEKPVISTRLPEIVEFNRSFGDIVHLADSADSFAHALERAIEEDSAELARMRVEAAKANSWEARIEQMCSLIENVMQRKDLEHKDWRATFSRICRASPGKVFGLAFCGALLFFYLMLFYTPLIWFLARPLVISEGPRKADAVVIFGGGVGEAGKPGRSTIERTRHGVSLLKRGYAPIAVFSTGYMYDYKEAEDMKLLAQSLGIERSSIILEQKASSTYENIIFVKDILKSTDAKRIILVSSPYHMLRSKLVFKKVWPEIEVIYSPVTKSEFYDETTGSRTAQIWAIWHEYAGILFYFLRGHI